MALACIYLIIKAGGGVVDKGQGHFFSRNYPCLLLLWLCLGLGLRL